MAAKNPTKSLNKLKYIAKTSVNNLTDNEIFEKIIRPKSYSSYEASKNLLKTIKPVEELSSAKKFISKNHSFDRLVFPKMDNGNYMLKTQEILFPIKNQRKML